MCGRPVPVFGILEMDTYQGTRRNVSMMELYTYIIVFKEAQKNLGNSTHTIGIMRSMKMMAQF